MTGNNQNHILQKQNVVKTYSTGDGSFMALDKVNVDIQQGEFLGITGKSMAGSTFNSTFKTPWRCTLAGGCDYSIN